MASEGSRNVVVAVLAAATALAIAKLVALHHTASSAMLSTAVHSLLDASFLALLWYGLRPRPATAAAKGDVPAGDDGRLPFWCFVVPVLLYGLGAGVTLTEGAERLLRPQPGPANSIDAAVLVAGIAMAAAALRLALSKAQASRAAGLGLSGMLRRPAHAPLLAVAMQSAGAIAGQVVAAASLAGVHLLDLPMADGAASMAIGLVLAAVAAAMAIEVKRTLQAGTETPGQSAAAAAGPAISAPFAVAVAVRAPETKSQAGIQAGATKTAEPPPASGSSAAAAAPAGKPQVVVRQQGKKGRGKHRR